MSLVALVASERLCFRGQFRRAVLISDEASQFVVFLQRLRQRNPVVVSCLLPRAKPAMVHSSRGSPGPLRGPAGREEGEQHGPT